MCVMEVEWLELGLKHYNSALFNEEAEKVRDTRKEALVCSCTVHVLAACDYLVCDCMVNPYSPQSSLCYRVCLLLAISCI